MIEREYKTVETRKEKRRREKVAPCMRCSVHGREVFLGCHDWLGCQTAISSL
jgi:hypothetical protein